MDYKIHQIFISIIDEEAKKLSNLHNHLVTKKLAVPKKMIEKVQEKLKKEIGELEQQNLNSKDLKIIYGYGERIISSYLYTIALADLAIKKKQELLNGFNFYKFDNFKCIEKIAGIEEKYCSREDKKTLLFMIVEKTGFHQKAIGMLVKQLYKYGHGDFLYSFFKDHLNKIQVIETENNLWHEKTIKLFLEFCKNPDINFLTRSNDNFLFLSVRKNNLVACKNLIENGANLGLKNPNKQAVLELNLKSGIAQKRSPEQVRQLELLALEEFKTQKKIKSKIL